MNYYLITLGCPKNEVDSEAMARLLQLQGHRSVAVLEEADVFIVNTCGFLDAARHEALEEIRSLARAKREDQFLVAAGCLVQRDGAALFDQVPDIDALIGTRRWQEIGDLLYSLQNEGHHSYSHGPVRLGDPPSGHAVQRGRLPASRGWAYLKISDGCNAKCAFCTIPSIKGPQHSYPADGIVAEAQSLSSSGAQEIILIGQNTTAYAVEQGQRDGLVSLLRALLDGVPEMAWLRLMYAYPAQVSPGLIELMASESRFCNYLDMPLQHAHPDTLKRMKRPHGGDQALPLIERLRAAMPDVAIRSTFIVGYPGETKDEFDALLQFVQEAHLDRVGVFQFSPEPGTVAAELPDQIAPELMQSRYDQIMGLQQQISLRQNQLQIGRRLDVLVEGHDQGWSIGRSYRDAPEIDGLVLLEGELPVARMAPVLVTGAMEYDLLGQPA